MAKASRRRTSLGMARPSPHRKTSRVFAYPIGIGYKTGRRASPATRRSLPRSVLPSPTVLVRNGHPFQAPFIRRPVRTVVSVPVRTARRAVSNGTSWIQPRDLALPRNPELKTKHYNFCQLRKRRRSVLFSLDVAGRKWGRGGPGMRSVRRTELSNYTCG